MKRQQLLLGSSIPVFLKKSKKIFGKIMPSVFTNYKKDPIVF
jgi:hypothetical protein